MPASRLRRLLVLTVCACSFGAGAAPLASASPLDPVVSGLKLLGAVGAGNPVALDLSANDAVAPIEGIEVDFGDGSGRQAESTCFATPSFTKPSPFNTNDISRFRIAHTYTSPGVTLIRVTVTAGDCLGSTALRTTETLPVTIPPAGVVPPVVIPPLPGLPPLVGGGAIASAGCANADLRPARGNLAKIRRAVLCHLNQERRARGRGALRGDGSLDRAAAGHSRDMVRRAYFAHTAPNGTDMVSRIRQAGFLRSASGYTLAENIGWGTRSVSTARTQVQMWMNSSGHRFNILYKNFKQIGIGVVLGTPRKVGQAGATFTTDFGVRF